MIFTKQKMRTMPTNLSSSLSRLQSHFRSTVPVEAAREATLSEQGLDSPAVVSGWPPFPLLLQQKQLLCFY